MELSAILVPVPLTRLTLILHLGDDLAGQIALLAGSVDAHKLSLAGKVSLIATLESLALLGYKLPLTWGIFESNTHELENDDIIMLEQVCLVIKIFPGLVLGQ